MPPTVTNRERHPGVYTGGIQMTRNVLIVWGALLAAGVTAAQEAPALNTQEQKASYALGLDLGNQLRKEKIEVDPSLFYQGLKDALSGGKALLTDQQVKDAIAGLQAEMKKREYNRRKGTEEDNAEATLLSAYNKRTGDAFLAGNKVKQGVVTLPNGLQYKVIKAGEGRTPTEGDMVVCQYRGTLLEGTEFDSSYKRGQPVTFSVKGVIPGWREALQLMPVGSKWELFIPPDLAYGEKGVRSGVIGPNATVKFELELLAIK
jgi:FKBP-type peptidyl-prolyl cis-trans isomerase FklB